LVSLYESERTLDIDWGYIIQPSDSLRAVWHYQPREGTAVPWLVYTSETAERMTAQELAELVK
jgi:hypothetical protein